VQDIRESDVVDETPASDEQALVFLAARRLADHDASSSVDVTLPILARIWARRYPGAPRPPRARPGVTEGEDLR